MHHSAHLGLGASSLYTHVGRQHGSSLHPFDLWLTGAVCSFVSAYSHAIQARSTATGNLRSSLLQAETGQHLTQGRAAWAAFAEEHSTL